MRRKSWAIASSVGLVASLGSLVAVAPSGADAASGRVTLAGTLSAGARPSAEVAAVAKTATIGFEVSLDLPDLRGAEAFAQAVSDPASPAYRHYLTTAQWEARYSPTVSAVSATSRWLRSQHLTPGAVSGDRMTVHVSGTAAHIEKAFGIGINYYKVNGHDVRLASTDATIPASLSGIVGGVVGVNEIAATPDSTTGSDRPAPAVTTKAEDGTIPQPPGFRNPPECSSYYGQKTDPTATPYGGGYADVLPEAVCGYKPKQFQSAYGLSADYAKGLTGKGVTVAIVDAYASPTLLSDAQTYFALNDSSDRLSSSQFAESLPASYNRTTACAASGWFGEQTLDVEAVHTMAPGADILYVGSKSCFTLYDSVQQVVDNHSADIITDSWGDDAGDLLDSSSSRNAFDHILLMAGGTGIGVQFSAGDSGDEFSTTGLTAADYPSSSPYATAVGGTSLGVNAKGAQSLQVGWSTGKSLLCNAVLYGDGTCSKSTKGTYLPPAPGGYDYGGGGGTSFHYAEPSYQVGVVPTALADRNASVTEEANRVEPDISMDADPTTGMLVGETQIFPSGTYYDQYRIGGTSLASPLFAGVMAVADQAAGTSLGFANPLLYAADAKTPAAFDDIVDKGKLALTRVDYINGINTKDGLLTSVRILDYEGSESYCDGTGSCETRDVALDTTKGFDSMTGIGSIGPSFVSTLAKY